MVTSASSICAQDTITIYFGSGKRKVSSDQFELLNNIPNTFDLSDLETVHFFGMADSIGNVAANQRLGLDRAKNVEKYCQALIPKNVKTNVFGIGEVPNSKLKINRRVEVVLIFRKKPKTIVVPSIAQDDTLVEKKKVEPIIPCYNIDRKLLHRSHFRYITKKEEEFVIVEVLPGDLPKKNVHFYGTRNENNEFEPTPVKWMSRRTGNKWWAKTRYIATIPKASFDQYSIFEISEPPCDTCSENFQAQTSVLKSGKCEQVDRFLMQNLQYRTGWLSRRFRRIRAPREFVNLNDQYFIGCGLKVELNWEIRKGRWRKNYYFAKLPVRRRYLANITRVMECCVDDPEPSDCDKGICGVVDCGGTPGSIVIGAEVGSEYQDDQISIYGGLTMNMEGDRGRISSVFGLDNQFHFYGAVRFQYHFLSFPLNMPSPFKVWRRPGNPILYEPFARLYVGLEVKTKAFNDAREDAFMPNVHLGFALVDAIPKLRVTRIFLQSGIGFNGFDFQRSNATPIFQVGVNFNMLRINSRLF